MRDYIGHRQGLGGLYKNGLHGDYIRTEGNKIIFKAAPAGCREEGFRFKVSVFGGVGVGCPASQKKDGPPLYPHEDVAAAVRILKAQF